MHWTHALRAAAGGSLSVVCGWLTLSAPAAAQSDVLGWGATVFHSSWNDDFVDLEAGDRFVLGRRSDGQIVGWGDNERGQCMAPAAPAGTSWVQMSAGAQHGVARLSDGTLLGWGSNANGQLNLPAPAPGTSYVQVVATGFSSFALRSDGQVFAVGFNSGGFLDVPPAPPGLAYAELALGSSHGLGRLSDGTVVAWGDNGFGQSNVPPLPPGRTYVEVDASIYRSSARLDDGSVVVWGSMTGSYVPPAGTTYVEVAQGWTNVLLLRSDGVIESKGLNAAGEGDVPPLPPGRVYVEVVAGDRFCATRLDDGTLVTWDLNERLACNLPQAAPGEAYVQVAAGAAGGGSAATSRDLFATRTSAGVGQTAGALIGNLPTLPAGVLWRQFAVGGTGTYPPNQSAGHALGLRSDGNVLAWGSTPGAPALPAGLTYTQVAAGWRHSVALRSDGTAVCFGDNSSGQCNAPPPAAGTSFVSVGAGQERSAALQSDGQIVVWGLAAAPPILPPGVVYVELVVGSHHLLARRSDGAVVGWGLGFSGETQMPPLPPGRSVLGLAAGNQFSLALLDDGSLLGFGNNAFGQRDVPVPAAGHVFASIDAGQFSGAAVQSPLAPPVAYCTSRPSSIPGCVPALSAPLHAASVTAGKGSFRLRAAPVPGGPLVAVAIYSTSGPLGTPTQSPFGLLCIAAPVSRLLVGLAHGTQGNCNGAYELDLGQFLASQQSDPALVAGATVDVQVWYRDPPNPGGANLTHALSFDLAP
jgi:alpha-tubulin suppressor-like RCC1 family protein